MTRALLLVLAACAGPDPSGTEDGVVTGDDDDDDDVPPPPATLPPCDDTSSTPVFPTEGLEQRSFEERSALVAIPAAPRAVLFVFHGTGGDVTNLVTPHYLRIWNVLHDVGIGVVGLDSVDRTGARWDGSDDPARNEDFVDLAALRDELIAEGRFSASTPILAWGFSNGGSFTAPFSRMAAELGWDVRANVVHNSSCGRTDVPVFFTSAENDDETPATERAYEDAVAAGIEASFTVTLERPWTPESMLLNPDYDLEEGQAVFDELVALGAIDADGARLVAVGVVDGAMSAYEASSTLPGPSRVTTLLRVAWATHRPTSELACEERDFLLSHLP